MTEFPDDLVGWLLLQLDEDERVARAADAGRWLPEDKGITFEYYADEFPEGEAQARLVADTRANQYHIAEWSPGRVLREVEAKRRMLGRHFHLVDNVARRLGLPDMCGRCGGTWPCADLRDLASIYVDRPGYRQEWAP